MKQHRPLSFTTRGCSGSDQRLCWKPIIHWSYTTEGFACHYKRMGNKAHKQAVYSSKEVTGTCDPEGDSSKEEHVQIPETQVKQSDSLQAKNDRPSHSKILKRIKLPKNLKTVNLSKYDIEDSELFYAVLNMIKFPLEVKQLILRGHNGVREIPLLIGRFENLEELNLSNNCIEEIPWAIVYLKKLRILDLSHNLLTQLPKTVCYLSELQILKLQANHITHLPSELTNLQKLREIDLSNNTMLESPSLSVCAHGVKVTSIFAEIEKRKLRRDMWEFTKPWIGEVGSSEYNKSMKSLHELCIFSILSHKVDFLAPSFVPTNLKSCLQCKLEQYVCSIQLAKCSVCGGYFSSKLKFNSHNCKK